MAHHTQISYKNVQSNGLSALKNVFAVNLAGRLMDGGLTSNNIHTSLQINKYNVNTHNLFTKSYFSAKSH